MRRAETLLTDILTSEQIGSIIQWYESLDKYPVTVFDKKAMGSDSFTSGDLEKT